MKKKPQSAEHMAMRDIAEYIYEQANDIAILYRSPRTFTYSYGFWDSNVHMVVAKMFVCTKRIATKQSRLLNRKLGLHKINK